MNCIYIIKERKAGKRETKKCTVYADSQDISAFVNFYICVESMDKIGENELMLKVLKRGT